LRPISFRVLGIFVVRAEGDKAGSKHHRSESNCDNQIVHRYLSANWKLTRAGNSFYFSCR
jgi:hypothetical protein